MINPFSSNSQSEWDYLVKDNDTASDWYVYAIKYVSMSICAGAPFINMD